MPLEDHQTLDNSNQDKRSEYVVQEIELCALNTLQLRAKIKNSGSNSFQAPNFRVLKVNECAKRLTNNSTTEHFGSFMV